jgi:hypothetical protein
MKDAIFIPSLHRPFSQQLKCTKWVCSYIASKKERGSGSSLNLGFFHYLILFLQKEYSAQTPEEYNGLPSITSVNNIFSHIKTVGKKNFIEQVPSIIKSRQSPLEKQSYSVYKAASYYVNLAKDKFGLLNEKNELTENGKLLLSLRSPNLKLSQQEKDFFFKRVLDADFHLFITHCLFEKFEKRYDLKNTIDEQLEFIEQYLKIRHFNFTSASLANYNIVRAYWVNILGVVDRNGNIKKRFLSIIEDNAIYSAYFTTLKVMLEEYEKNSFKSRKGYFKNKRIFLQSYKDNASKNVSDLGFINLYDIKKEMNMSNERFQNFLNNFYEQEKSNLNIFFGNNVNSIDRRERFFIRQRPVIKIKIK